MQLLAFLEFIFGFGVVGIVISIIATIFWLWMLGDAIINPKLDSTEKIIWVLVIIFLNVLGALLYFLMARGKGAGTPTA